MDTNLLDLLPIVVCEMAPVRNEAGEIVDFEWLSANRLLNESILPGGGSVVGRRASEFDPDFFEKDTTQAAIRAIETGKRQSVISRSRQAKGLPHRVMKSSFVPRHGHVLSCSHGVTDIALDRDDARHRYSVMHAAFDHAVHAGVLNDHEGTMIYVNTAMHVLLGYEPGELHGEPLIKIMHPEDYELGLKLAVDLISGRQAKDVRDRRLISKSGEVIVVSSGLSCVVSDVTGLPIFISTGVDVREERRKAHELNDALNRAEQATRMKSEFLANMSHEIRTPLNGVLGMAQVLAQGQLTAAQRDQVSVILDSGTTLMVLLNDILDLSKIEAGHMEISPVPDDMRHKLSGLFKLHEATAREKGIGIKLFVHPDVPSRLMFDPVRVRQCVSNLVSNAIKFTAEGEVMVVVTSAPDGPDAHTLTVHVSDSGCGIAPDKMERIFESFAQEDGSTTRRFGGTGLGLSITRKLARMMGGDVRAVSEPGRGSVFTLTFKAGTHLQAIATIAHTVSPATANAERNGLTGCRALVVDDNAINRRVARSFLEIHGLQISEAGDGNQALDILAREKFDIVLMDIHMPGLDGGEAFKRLRTTGNPNRLTPVIALTADSMHGDREKFLAKGFDGYVSKPIDERSLVTAITQTLSLPPEVARTLLQAS